MRCLLIVTALVSAAADACKASSDCSPGLTCVIDAPHSFSQCVNCSASSFSSACFNMNDPFLAKAEDQCGIARCKDRCPHHADTDCDASKKCAVQSDGYFSQCIDCTPGVFSTECKFLSEQMRSAAEAKCNLKCGSIPTPPPSPGTCKVDADCGRGLSCVVDAAHYFSQCVDCSETSFGSTCFNMNDPFLLKAEEKCGIASCKDRCPRHTKAECDAEKTCVVQGDGYFTQCIDCDETVFESNCKYWSPQIRDAAEKTCNHKCPKVGDITV